ncbi:hypothetical protein [Streptomyces sp. NPDC056600]|uniref:hypothetical protein n=1 Tax=Streptomyces sp. NPDC056600 TaxID=3345874 RepID=UPI0036B3A6DF
MVGGVGACLVGVVLGLLDVTWTPVAMGLGLLLVGGTYFHRAARMGVLLAHHPWHERRVVRVEGARLRPTVVLDVEERGELWPLVVGLPWGQQVDVRGQQVLWAAGDPRFGVVVSPPGGNQFRLALPARGRRLRRVAAVPEVRVLPGRLLTDVRPAVRRRRVFRWVLLLGVGCFLLAVIGSRTDDAEVGLTVLDRGPGGHCVVRFDDPFTGEEREESYHCDEGGDAALRNFETGQVVHRWPGPAVLYNDHYQERPGPPPLSDVADGLGHASLGLMPLALVGAVAGRVFHLRRWRRAVEVTGHRPSAPEPDLVKPDMVRASAPGTAPAEKAAAGKADGRASAGHSLSPAQRLSLDHAGVVARAERLMPHAEPAIPERDWRTSPWWRVRGLRLSAGEGELFGWLSVQLGALLLLLCLLVLLPTAPAWSRSPVLLGLLALSAAWSGWTLYRRLPAVRALRAVAAAPRPRRRRYVLLPMAPRPRAEAQRLLLVVFPEDGGDEARAEGLLEVQAPGTKRHPWAGLPAPTGTVELHGPAGEAAPVVPVIGDLVLWPVGVFEEVGRDGLDRRGLLAVTATP